MQEKIMMYQDLGIYTFLKNTLNYVKDKDEMMDYLEFAKNYYGAKLDNTPLKELKDLSVSDILEKLKNEE